MKKIKNFSNFGIPLNEDILNIIQMGIKKAGSIANFVDATKIGYSTMNFYLNSNKPPDEEDNGKRDAKYISWRKWPKIRDYLASVGLLDATDPQWMTPDELRKGGRETRYGISDGPDVEPEDLPPMPDMKSLARAGVSSSPKRFYWAGIPHSEPSSADFLSRLMACADIPADVKVLIFQEHERFLSDFGTKRHDSAQHGTLARFSTGGNETNV